MTTWRILAAEACSQRDGSGFIEVGSAMMPIPLVIRCPLRDRCGLIEACHRIRRRLGCTRVRGIIAAASLRPIIEAARAKLWRVAAVVSLPMPSEPKAACRTGRVARWDDSSRPRSRPVRRCRAGRSCDSKSGKLGQRFRASHPRAHHHLICLARESFSDDEIPGERSRVKFF